jgi:hypothetical protein
MLIKTITGAAYASKKQLQVQLMLVKTITGAAYADKSKYRCSLRQ